MRGKPPMAIVLRPCRSNDDGIGSTCRSRAKIWAIPSRSAIDGVAIRRLAEQRLSLRQLLSNPYYLLLDESLVRNSDVGVNANIWLPRCKANQQSTKFIRETCSEFDPLDRIRPEVHRHHHAYV